MPQVQIWGSLSAAADHQTRIDVDAETIGDVLSALTARYPGLAPQIERGVSVAVDGKIYRDSLVTPVSPDSEVVILPLLAGG